MRASAPSEAGFACVPLQRLTVALVPAPAEQAFLRACLMPGEAAGRAWNDWLTRTGDPLAELRRDRVGIKRHLPRLYANLSSTGCTVARAHEPYLRAAVAREQMRSQRYRAALAQALDALAAAGIDATLLKGAAIGEVLLEAPWWRHSHDVDLHVSAAALEAAAQALASAGFRPHTATPTLRRLDHANGLPICLHAHLLQAGPLNLPEAALLARRIDRRAVERPVRLLRAEDMLAHVCCHAAVHGSRLSLGWIVDAVSLLRTDGFDARRLADLLNTPAGCLLAPALRVLDDLVPGCVPAACRSIVPPLGTHDHAARDVLRQAAAVSLGWRPLLAASRDWRERLAVSALLVARWPAGIRSAIRATWRDPRFTHLRRQPMLRPLRRIYLRVKPAGVRSADQTAERSWRERGLS